MMDIDNQYLKDCLHRLGFLIRKHGEKEPKRHGNYWRLVLHKDIYLYHDDYNYSVSLKSDKGTLVYYGIDFGGFETKASINGFEKMMNILNSIDSLAALKALEVKDET